ncbi:MAG: flagellar basal body P-ring protein FlgI [Gammaproteobacteria bacterium]|jgi:flagellar P-ring protein precursor FlgI|nr:flagellar basal body P-ring protein FlgI [Gammaproteobacteria bacterium]
MQILQRTLCTGLSLLLALSLLAPLAHAERIKDIGSFGGVRGNQLIGYGLVVGLDGSGDQTTQTPFTVQSVKNMLAKLGVVVTANVDPQLKNVAAVMVHAELPPFASPGQTIDVTVSSLGNAKSLRGGALLMTPLKGVDGQLYAMAQGNLVVSGFGAEGADGSSIAVNVSNSGRIPNGAMVERAVPNPFASDSSLRLSLNSHDFTTAMRVAETINESLGPDIARAVDGATIDIDLPPGTSNKVAFVSAVENLPVKPGSAPARVIVNSRSGTVVIGSEVRVMPAAVAHGNLTVSISENFEVSQPGPFARRGDTAITPNSNVAVDQEGGRMFYIDPGITLKDLVDAVNRVGAAPGDLVAILEALEQAGALRAELTVI